MGMFTRSVGRAMLVGAGSGILSQSALATIVTRTPSAELPGLFANRWIRRAIVAGAVGEVLANALVPSLPPRTDPAPRAGRMVLGAVAGGLVAGDGTPSRVAGAVAGGAVAQLTTWGSTTSRAKLSQLVPDKLIAAGETVVAFGLARLATR